MNFGPWLRAQRRELDVDIKTFARQAGVDPSTISRIENERSEANLFTGTSILLALGVTPTRLVAELKEHEPRTQDEIVRAGKTDEVLSEEDIDDIRYLYGVDRLAALTLLADLFNKVLTHPGSLGGAKSAEDPGAPHEIDDGLQSRFTSTEVRRFLADSPLYECEVKYPADMNHREILRLYELGGVLIQGDVATFARILRRRNTVRAHPLAMSVRRWEVQLERLELGLTDRVSLADVLTMDERLGDAEQPRRDNLLLGMFWRIAQYNGEVGVARSTARGSVAEEKRWLDAEHRLVNVTVTLCRWLQYLNGKDFSWLRDFREDIKSQSEKVRQRSPTAG